MKKFTLATLLVVCFLLGSPHNGFSRPDPVLMPPQLSKAFIAAAYRGKRSTHLYRLMTQSFIEQVRYTEFRQKLRDWIGPRTSSKVSLLLLRQEALSHREGILYYLVQIQHRAVFKNKHYFSLEKVKVVIEGDRWKLKDIPIQLIASEMNERINQQEYIMVYHIVEKDRKQEALTYSLNTAISRSLFAARNLAQDGSYRNALMEYQKVLHLNNNHEEALSGMDYCQNQLVQDEDTD